MSNEELVKAYLAEIIEVNDFNENKIRSFLDNDFIQYVNGQKLDLEQCIKHVKVVKSQVTDGKLTFEKLFSDANKVCTVHVAEGKKIDGSVVKFKVIGCLEIKDSKIIIFDELTHLLVGNATDSDMTSRY